MKFEEKVGSMLVISEALPEGWKLEGTWVFRRGACESAVLVKNFQLTSVLHIITYYNYTS